MFEPATSGSALGVRVDVGGGVVLVNPAGQMLATMSLPESNGGLVPMLAALDGDGVFVGAGLPGGPATDIIWLVLPASVKAQR